MAEVSFKYSFTLDEIRRNYELELESPRWKRLTLICLIIFAAGMILGNILLNIIPWFASAWEWLALLLWICLLYPVISYYQITRLVAKRHYQEFTFDGEEKELCFSEEGYSLQTASTYRKFKWDGAVDAILETKEQFVIRKTGAYSLIVYKSKLPHETVSRLREIFRSVPVATRQLESPNE